MATEIERLIAVLEARTDKYDKAFAKAQKLADGTFDKIEKRGKQNASRMAALNPQLGGLLRSFVALGAASVSIEGVRRAVESVAQIGDVAERIGVTTDALQELRFAAEQSGASAQALDVGLAEFARNTADAASGKAKDFAAVLVANNVALRDSEGKLRPVAELLRDYANLVQNAATEQERLRLAQLAFGGSGEALIGTVRDGAAGLGDMTAKARELGVVLGEDTVKAAKKLDDEFAAIMARMATAWKGFVVNVTATGGNIFKNFLDGLKRGAVVLDLGRPQVEIDQANADAVRQFGQSRAAAGRAPTVVPNVKDDEARKRSAEAAAREAEKVRELIAALEREHAALGQTNVQKRIANELSRAGVDANSAQGKAIAGLVTSIAAEEAALKKIDAAFEQIEQRQQKIAEGTEFLGSTFEQAALAIAGGTQKASDAIREMAVQLAIAAAKALLLGQGPLAGLFGPGSILPQNLSPGINTQIASGTGGLFAGGGVSNRPAIFGEAGPEAAVPLPDGRRIPVDLRGSNDIAGQVIVHNHAPAGHEVETQRSRGPNGETVIRNIVKRVGSEFGLRRPALAR